LNLYIEVIYVTSGISTLLSHARDRRPSLCNRINAIIIYVSRVEHKTLSTTVQNVLKPSHCYLDTNSIQNQRRNIDTDFQIMRTS
jgi:hypothetical protein